MLLSLAGVYLCSTANHLFGHLGKLVIRPTCRQILTLRCTLTIACETNTYWKFFIKSAVYICHLCLEVWVLACDMPTVRAS